MSIGERERRVLTDSTTPGGNLLARDRAHEIEMLKRLLAQVEGDTGEEHADRRRRLSDAIRSVLAKHT